MNGKRKSSSDDVVKIIDHIESLLSHLKEAIKETKGVAAKDKKKFRSIREYEFCGMWKDREDIKNISSNEWLAKLRRKQWNRVK